MSDSRPVVLAVDDIPANLDLLREILSDEYKVKVANNGEKALQLAGRDPRPDIILLDIMMPGMSGYDVCQKLKQHPDTTPIPVIFVTAMGQVEDEQRGLALGAVDYITKPFNHDIVKARVRTHVDNYDKTRQLISEVRQLRDHKTHSFTDFDEPTLAAMIQSGEGHLVEFKPTLRWDLLEDKAEKANENACLKTVAGYLNADGGTLLVGVDDEGEIVGLCDDHFEDEDELLRHWVNLIKSYLGAQIIPNIRSIIHSVAGNRLLVVECLPSSRPAFFRRDNEESFNVRMGNATQALKTSEGLAYIEQRFSDNRGQDTPFVSQGISPTYDQPTDDHELHTTAGNEQRRVSSLSEWFEELRQRRVIRTAILYVALAWGFTEIMTTVAETFDAPSWLGRTIVLGFIAGFPITILLAWVYDMRITRTDESASSSSKARTLWFVGVLAVASVTAIAMHIARGSG